MDDVNGELNNMSPELNHSGAGCLMRETRADPKCCGCRIKKPPFPGAIGYSRRCESKRALPAISLVMKRLRGIR